MAEHVIVLALVAVSAIGAWSALGASIEHRVECVAGALGRRAADCAARAARPAASTARARAALVREPARDGSYATRLREALDALADRPTFDALSGRDGRITRDDLAAVLAQPGAYDDRARAAARFLLSSDAARNALDVGAGRGDVDRTISADDARGVRETLAAGDRGTRLRELLADAAAGDGGRDHRWSQQDLDALARDASVPESILAWARDATPTAKPGCGWNPICHVSHAAKALWSASADARSWLRSVAGHARDALAWTSRVAERLSWVATVVPPLDPRKWGEWAEVKLGAVRGAFDWAAGTAKAVFDTTRAIVTGDGAYLAELGRSFASMPSALWHSLETVATARPRLAGRAGAGLLLDVGTMLIPGGGALKGARAAARVGRGSVRRAAARTLTAAEAREASVAALPPAIRDWMFAEQQLLDRGADPARIIAPLATNQAARFTPENARVFTVQSYWLDAGADAEVVTAHAVPRDVSGLFFRTIRGRRQARLLVHPESRAVYREALAGAERGEDFLATPTSSSRTLLAWLPGHEQSPVFAKVSLDRELGGLVRNVSRHEVVRSIAKYQLLETETGLPPSFRVLPEVVGVVPRRTPHAGMIVRTIPKDIVQGRSRFVPLFSLYANPPGGGPPMLARMIARSGLPASQFVRERIVRPFVREWRALRTEHGVTTEPHAQNVLIRVGDDGLVTGEFLHRDLAGLTPDVAARRRRGRSVPALLRSTTRDGPPPPRDKLRTYFGAGFLYNLDTRIAAWRERGWVGDADLSRGMFERMITEEIARAALE